MNVTWKPGDIMFRPLTKGAGTASELVSGKGASDALLKALQESRLDFWTALRLLHDNTHPGVHGYICNRLPELGEATVERYLLQLIYLAVNKPGQQLERILLTLCKHSFRVAIKVQWFLLALSQDHPKSRALEAFKDQAYNAALEGKWEVPIRTARLDPVSPYNSMQLSPPFCSPSSSYIAGQVPNGSHVARGALPLQPLVLPNGDFRDDAVATQPPCSMVMSPPGTASATGLSSALKRDDDVTGAPAPLQRRSGAIQTLGCLLPSEQREQSRSEPAAPSLMQPQHQEHQPKTADSVGSKSTWLDDNGVSALAPAIRTSAPSVLRGATLPPVNDASDGCIALAVLSAPEAIVTTGAAAVALAATPAAGAGAAVTATSHLAPAATAVRATAFATPTAAAHVRQALAATDAVGGLPGAANGILGAAVTASIAERIQALKRELGEGEGVSALLERAKQQGMAPVAAVEDDALFSEDELTNRPMSPLSRLRYDTFGATLDFVDALCYASSSLTNYSQEERQNALRICLDHINHEIEKANRREVAIWFPMGRRGDRVLRLASRDAVLLNSREKAPFMLFVEVLEGQNECGDNRDGTDAFAGLSAGADVRGHVESLGSVGGGLSASMMALSPGPRLEFGRRETYGIALTGIGAQHQLQYMHSTPNVGGAAAGSKQSGPAAAAGKNRCGPGGGGQASLNKAAASPSSGGPGQGPAGDTLFSPTPTRAASATQASTLEEQAETLAAARRGAADTDAAGGAAHANAPAGATRYSPGLSPSPSLSPSPGPVTGTIPAAGQVQQVATEVFIPTRSTSSSNIAAAAAAAMAASASVGAADSYLLASARSSDAGAVGAAIGGSGGQPQTPRGGSSVSGLPPRPPSSASSMAQASQQNQQQHPPSQPPLPQQQLLQQQQPLPQQQLLQQQPLLPVGGMSPVNAAKEVSATSSGQESSGLLAASNLLRRVFGDRAEAAAAAGGGEEQGAVSNIAAASTQGRQPLAAFVDATRQTLMDPARQTAAPPQPTDSHPLLGRMQELAPLGLFSHSQAGGKSGPEVMAMLSDISASLRGEMPMVRVRIVPVRPNDADAARGGGNGATSFSLATLGSRAKAALLSQQPPAQPPQPPQPQPSATPEDATEGGQSKAAQLLSRLGWGRKSAADDDAGAVSAAPTAAVDAAAAAAAAGAAGLQVTIPVTSGASLTAKRTPGGSAYGREPRLVRLVLTVATQGVNLDIKSPHRKSRRTPSHEAIEMMADKFKIYKLPPPPEFGPPLGPGPYTGSSCIMDRVAERASEEGEGGAPAAIAAAAATAPSVAEAAEASTVGEAEAHAWAYARSVGRRSVDSVRPSDWRLEADGTAAVAPQPAAVKEAKDVALGPPLSPEWGSRSGSVVSHPSPVTPPPEPSLCEAVEAMKDFVRDAKGSETLVAEAVPAVSYVVPKPQSTLSTAVLGGRARDRSPPRSSGLLEKRPPFVDSKAVDAGGGGVTGAVAAPAVSSSGLAASLQSSLTRILNRASPPHHHPADGAVAASAAAPAAAASLHVAVAPAAAPGTGSSTGYATDVNGAAGTAAPGGSGLAASLQSSLTRILNRTPAAQPPSVLEAVTSTSSGSGTCAHPSGLRGASPVRGSGGGSGGPAAAAAAAPEPPAGEAPPASSSSSSGLAASLQSSLTRILNRSAPQAAAEGACSASASSASAVVGGGSPIRGSSPVRGKTGSGGGPCASHPNVAGDGAGQSTTSRLSKLLGRMHQEQPQPPAPSANVHIPAQQQQPLPSQSLKHQHEQQEGPVGGALLPRRAESPAAELPLPSRPLPSRPLPYGLPKVTDGRYERESLEERRRREAHAVYGERWGAKVKRIQGESPHGRRQGWALRCVIVKSGDDCRQELLALQLVRAFGDIFSDAGLPLWVRYYEVLVTSNRTALIEMVPNTLSIHTIKSRSPPGTSLSDHFFAKFGRSGSPECTAAQRRFTESLAAYSLICYLLQIKDRHNGNILVDDDGRVVHIDYGFLLSNSPGGVNFESAPFKLTRELLEVMDSNSDGRPSEMFDYFKVLMIQGFIAVRNCSDRILLLVKIMAKSGFPCFKGGDRALKALEKRFMSSLSEVQCVEHVLQLIAESLDSWRTRQYDYYQRVLNGIL